jgi:hypothetical protein
MGVGLKTHICDRRISMSGVWSVFRREPIEIRREFCPKTWTYPFALDFAVLLFARKPLTRPPILAKFREDSSAIVPKTRTETYNHVYPHLFVTVVIAGPCQPPVLGFARRQPGSKNKQNPKARKVLGFFYRVPRNCHGISASDPPPAPDCHEGAIGVARADPVSAFASLLAVLLPKHDFQDKKYHDRDKQHQFATHCYF